MNLQKSFSAAVAAFRQETWLIITKSFLNDVCWNVIYSCMCFFFFFFFFALYQLMKILNVQTDQDICFSNIGVQILLESLTLNWMSTMKRWPIMSSGKIFSIIRLNFLKFGQVFFKKQPKSSGFVIAFLVQRVLAELKSPKIVFSSKLWFQHLFLHRLWL